MTGSRLDRADFWTSIVLVVFATAIIVESWRMDRLEELDIEPFTAPGLIPGLLGVLLLLCGIALGVRSVMRGGWRSVSDDTLMDDAVRNGTVGRVGLTLFLTLGFAIGLFGHMPFAAAATIFVFAFIILLGGPFTERGLAAARRLGIALAIGIVSSFAIWWGFTKVFYVKLP